MADNLNGARIGIALTGSFCTFGKIFDVLPAFIRAGARLYPIFSYAVSQLDTRFFTAAQVREKMKTICGREPWDSIPMVEPIGPKKLLDLLVIAPCTGNTCAKLACGIADTPVTMACKSQLRNKRPVLIALSSNDGLSVAARNIGILAGRKQMFFAPYGQDDPDNKPDSLVFDENLLLNAANLALEQRQIQPILVKK